MSQETLISEKMSLAEVLQILSQPTALVAIEHLIRSVDNAINAENRDIVLSIIDQIQTLGQILQKLYKVVENEIPLDRERLQEIETDYRYALDYVAGFRAAQSLLGINC